MEKKENSKELDVKELNIFEKMSLITKEMAVVEKNLEVKVNQNSGYKAVSERDILDNVKPLEEKYRVYSYPVDRRIVDSDTLTKETEYNGKVTKTNQFYMRLEITYRFVNVDKPEEFIEIKSYGDGIDSGDKSPGKAMTYGDKYALMKGYKISTGDDPDKDASPEEGYTKEEKLASPKQIEILSKYYVGDNLTKLLNANKIESLADMPMKKATELIGTIMEKGNK
jgi:hypothetical protein